MTQQKIYGDFSQTLYKKIREMLDCNEHKRAEFSLINHNENWGFFNYLTQFLTEEQEGVKLPQESQVTAFSYKYTEIDYFDGDYVFSENKPESFKLVDFIEICKSTIKAPYITYNISNFRIKQIGTLIKLKIESKIDDLSVSIEMERDWKYDEAFGTNRPGENINIIVEIKKQ